MMKSILTMIYLYILNINKIRFNTNRLNIPKNIFIFTHVCKRADVNNFDFVININAGSPGSPASRCAMDEVNKQIKKINY